jgi:hypothetical protein
MNNFQQPIIEMPGILVEAPVGTAVSAEEATGDSAVGISLKK